jgi:hypothetical protein
MATENEVDLDSIIDRLLEVRGSRPGKQVQLLEQEIRYLCTKAREIFISQPILLELEAPIKVCYAFEVFLSSLSCLRIPPKSRASNEHRALSKFVKQRRRCGPPIHHEPSSIKMPDR